MCRVLFAHGLQLFQKAVIVGIVFSQMQGSLVTHSGTLNQKSQTLHVADPFALIVAVFQQIQGRVDFLAIGQFRWQIAGIFRSLYAMRSSSGTALSSSSRRGFPVPGRLSKSPRSCASAMRRSAML